MKLTAVNLNCLLKVLVKPLFACGNLGDPELRAYRAEVKRVPVGAVARCDAQGYHHALSRNQAGSDLKSLLRGEKILCRPNS